MIYRVDELCDINSTTLKKDDNLKFINYLDTSNLTEGKIDEIVFLDTQTDKVPSRAKRVPKQNDILYSTVRPNQLHYGFIDKPIENLICSTGFAVLSPNEKVNPYYLYKYLTQKHIIEYLQGVAETSTSTYPSIKPSDIANLEIELPTLQEQKSIAIILSSLDDKIELNNKINKNLEEMAQTLYKQWFVDFEFPNEDGEPYKSCGGEMVESELGLIPKGFLDAELSQIANIDRGLSYKGKHLCEVGIPMINLGNVRPLGGFIYEKIKYYNGDYKSRHIVTTEDIIIANTDMTAKREILGTPILVPSRYEGDVIFSHHLYAIRNTKLPKEYLYYYFKSDIFKKMAENYANGTTVLAIGKNDVQRVKVLIPHSDLLNSFVNIATKLLSKIELNELENNRLSNIRDTLLPKLMSGEIEVPIEG